MSAIKAADHHLMIDILSEDRKKGDGKNIANRPGQINYIVIEPEGMELFALLDVGPSPRQNKAMEIRRSMQMLNASHDAALLRNIFPCVHRTLSESTDNEDFSHVACIEVSRRLPLIIGHDTNVNILTQQQVVNLTETLLTSRRDINVCFLL